MEGKTNSNKEKIRLCDRDGKSDIDIELSFGSVKVDKVIKEEFDARKKECSFGLDTTKALKAKCDDLVKSGYLDTNMVLNPDKALGQGNIHKLTVWAKRNINLIAEIADNGKYRCYERADMYEDPGAVHVTKHKIETADDERVIGIPYAQAMAGDRVYIVNGKVFTGWALYFSLSSIKSPEDYARNVDLVFNIPFLYGSLLLKAQLGLGCGFDVNYGAESEEVPEEQLIRRYLFDRLRINTRLLIKTAFHLGMYGNSYWHIRRAKNGLPDKLTILQPERMKVFLDPMTTKILFYIYLPPIIGGTTIASYPSDGRANPNILTGVTLSYPTPIVMHPEDIMHFKINDFTEYPFGFSDVRPCIDPATARLDINILAPILYKKYTKPMIHWALNTEGIGPKQVGEKKTEMISVLENMEPGSDIVTTDRWKSSVITVSGAKSEILDLTSDVDTQIFAATGCPETYFKPKGSTDRMISEQDKTFISRLKIPQALVAEQIEEKLIKPRIYFEHKQKKDVKDFIGEKDAVEDILKTYDSWLASEPKFPKVEWNEIFKQDETQAIANSIALLNAEIIDVNRAATKVGETPKAQQQIEDINKVGINGSLEVVNKPNIISQQEQPQVNQALGSENLNGNQANIGVNSAENPLKSTENNGNFNQQEEMERLRGGLKVGSNIETRNRNEVDVKDPSQLGGSRYAQHKLKGEKGDISQKHVGLDNKKEDKK